jgi:hypothetical protein
MVVTPSAKAAQYVVKGATEGLQDFSSKSIANNSIVPKTRRQPVNELVALVQT